MEARLLAEEELKQKQLPRVKLRLINLAVVGPFAPMRRHNVDARFVEASTQSVQLLRPALKSRWDLEPDQGGNCRSILQSWVCGTISAPLRKFQLTVTCALQS